MVLVFDVHIVTKILAPTAQVVYEIDLMHFQAYTVYYEGLSSV